MNRIENRWSDSVAPSGDGLESLAYRSRLLGSDRSLVNIFGGNTSTKSEETDHMGRTKEVLWVKGSGSDIANITGKGFAGLKLEEVLPLFDRPSMSDEEMIEYLDATTFEKGRPRQSIETLLHAFVPAKHVDHTHPDAIISIACAPNGKTIMREIYGERAAWVDYIRPGFTLSQQIGAAVRNNPQIECVVMGKHGLVAWGDDSKSCYENTLRIIGEAQAYLDELPVAAGEEPICDSVDAAEILGQVLPSLRGAIQQFGPAILQVDTSAEILAFVNSKHAEALSQGGAACPDHLVHTKRLPLFVNWQPSEGVEALRDKMVAGVGSYAGAYQSYFDENKAEGQTIFPRSPRVILIPGIGMITAGADAAGADVSAQLYRRAVVVLTNAARLGGFESLSAAESFGVEYWPLELYKLSLKPAPRELAGKVALITGAASGIGRAIARKYASEGAHIVIADRNLEGAKLVEEELVANYGDRKAMAVPVDVTSEDQVAAAFTAATLAYGGVDLVVNNAGIASSAPIEETTLEVWDKNHAILSTGYFLISREAFRLFRKQGSGGNIVFIGSKNSIAAGKNAAAYSSAKAAEIHLARCLAEEGGAAGIRINSVLPDGVLAGSSIWDGTWRAERAATYGIEPDKLEELYRNRTTLKVNIFPEDIAEAAFFFASSRSSKTTGGIITVDGGVPTAYVR
ncbi:MAG TPA: bifunctional aldolase/short-chain dehydrogenase [Fimbriimonas sp.]|nr:bifunctional aldolase/short-chain dehydrogenase [Fimbriimonas sp.]